MSPMTDREPIVSIHVAIHRGRGRRGWKDPARWTRLRAQLLSALSRDESVRLLDGLHDVSDAERTRLINESCDAVLRGGGESPEADAVCARSRRSWCRYSHVAACERVRRTESAVR
jgi:hypothetical protein